MGREGGSEGGRSYLSLPMLTTHISLCKLNTERITGRRINVSLPNNTTAHEMETFIFTVITKKPLVKLQSNENTYNTKSKITVPHGELLSLSPVTSVRLRKSGWRTRNKTLYYNSQGQPSNKYQCFFRGQWGGWPWVKGGFGPQVSFGGKGGI